MEEGSMIVIDSHLDLGMNALQWNRDLKQGVYDIRQREEGLTQKGRGRGTVALPEMRAGRVAVCCATVIARVSYPGNPRPGYNSPDIASAVAQGQLAYYRLLEEQGEVRLVADWPALEAHLGQWEEAVEERPPLGFILAMEGADPILSPEQVAWWWTQGLRVVSLSHYGVSAYAHGTDTEGGLTPLAPPLLAAMEEAGMILDLTHLSDGSFWQALEAFGGPVMASHNNCRELVPGVRQFSDQQIEALIRRDGVMGVALDAWMLYPGWIKGQTQPEVVSLEAVADQIDHICQLAGNSHHAAIGTDLDGGYGTEQCPHDLNTIADLQRIPDLLTARGYGEADIRAIMHGNWLRLFHEAWEG
jgi:membrane dipeptidase